MTFGAEDALAGAAVVLLLVTAVLEPWLSAGLAGAIAAAMVALTWRDRLRRRRGERERGSR